MHRVLFILIVLGIVIACVLGVRAVTAANHSAAAASAYGPGLYGNTMACGGTLNRGTIAVAHRWLRCGTRVVIRYHGRSVVARVQDRGPYVGGRDFDLTEGVTWRLCGCSATQWGVRTIRWSIK